MYKDRIKLWGLDKKNKRHEVKEILRQRARRRAVGKKTQAILRGRVVDMIDIDRYAKRKGLALYPEDYLDDGSAAPQHLICFTPPPTPLSLDAPEALQNIERFLHSYNAFVDDSIQSGLWTVGRDVMGFACVSGVEYPISARDRFFLSVERGVRRYNLKEMSQAYRQWRVAFEELRPVVQSRRPSQLLCLVELVAHLAGCNDRVANLLLEYLGHLVKDQGSYDSRMVMLQRLSQLSAGDLTGLTTAAHDCSRDAFSGHFGRKSFFLLDSETVLMDSMSGWEEAYGPQLSDLVLGWTIYGVEALRAARSVMEILMAAERYAEAEKITRLHIQRMAEMPYDGTVGGAFSHAYSYLTHLYLMTHDYAEAYECMLLKVENYFHALECRTDLPEDFILSSYCLLSSLAKRLGMHTESDKWTLEHEILKRRTDALAEDELSDLKSRAQTNLQTQNRTDHRQNWRPDPPSSQIPEAGISARDLRQCHYSTLAKTEPQVAEHQTGTESCTQ